MVLGVRLIDVRLVEVNVVLDHLFSETDLAAQQIQTLIVLYF